MRSYSGQNKGGRRPAVALGGIRVGILDPPPCAGTADSAGLARNHQSAPMGQNRARALAGEGRRSGPQGRLFTDIHYLGRGRCTFTRAARGCDGGNRLKLGISSATAGLDQPWFEQELLIKHKNNQTTTAQYLSRKCWCVLPLGKAPYKMAHSHADQR